MSKFGSTKGRIAKGGVRPPLLPPKSVGKGIQKMNKQNFFKKNRKIV